MDLSSITSRGEIEGDFLIRKVVSIVLFLVVFIILASCRTEKPEWKGTVGEEDGVIVGLA